MRRVAVKIGYLGDGFAGSQIQPGHRTVEGDVISDLTKIGSDEKEIELKFASRTDRGVNALGNAAVFNTAFDDDTVLLKALNAVSERVFYRSITEVSDNFNPRHADERIYSYILPKEGMNIPLAEQCAALFEGEHDFIRFCRPDGRPTVMNMRSVRITEKDDILVIEFRAKFFLWNVIRRTVSAISSVGRGSASLDDVRRALNGEPVSFGIARPDALTLIDVHYDSLKFKTGPPERDLRAEEELFRTLLRRSFFDSL